VQVALSADVGKRSGVYTEGDYPQVKPAGRKHNDLLDGDAVAVVHHAALRPIGVLEQTRQESVRIHQDSFDLLLPDVHLRADPPQPLNRTLLLGGIAGAEQEGADLTTVLHRQPSRREPVELDLSQRKLLDLVGTEGMAGGIVSRGAGAPTTGRDTPAAGTTSPPPPPVSASTLGAPPPCCSSPGTRSNDTARLVYPVLGLAATNAPAALGFS
jgi:hypothetical protein